MQFANNLILIIEHAYGLKRNEFIFPIKNSEVEALTRDL